MNKEKRRSLIPSLLLEQDGMRNSDLAKHFNVSKETIRSDMVYLEEKGVVEKSYGKAVVTGSYRKEKSYVYERLDKQKDEKIIIAKAASKLINNDSIIFLDSGSTVLAIAECLEEKNNVTVITNSLGVANVMMHQKNNHVYLASGFVSRQGMLVNGPHLIDSIQQFKFNFSFLGTNGLKFYDGPTCLNYAHIAVKQIVMNNSEEVVVLCTRDKFDDGAVMQFASWDEVDILISDGFPEKLVESLKIRNVKCIQAK